MLLIMFFIIILNIVAIALTYYCLSDIDKKDRLIVIAISVAIIYILTSFVYWISTKDVSIKEVSEMGKNLITFLFVPINGIVILPIFAKSYAKYKVGSLRIEHLRNRTLILGAILAILLMIECTYFKDIQNSVVLIIEKNQEEIKKKQQEISNNKNELTNDQVYGNQLIDGYINGTDNVILNQLRDNTVGNITDNRLQIEQNSNEIENQLMNNMSMD